MRKDWSETTIGKATERGNLLQPSLTPDTVDVLSRCARVNCCSRSGGKRRLIFNLRGTRFGAEDVIAAQDRFTRFQEAVVTEGITLPEGQDLQEYEAVKTEFHRVFGAKLRRLLCVECELQLTGGPEPALQHNRPQFRIETGAGAPVTQATAVPTVALPTAEAPDESARRPAALDCMDIEQLPRLKVGACDVAWLDSQANPFVSRPLSRGCI